MTNFVIIVECKEARSGYDNSVVVENNTKVLVTEETDGWVEATSSQFNGVFGVDAKLFASEADAVAFAKKWRGHPWYNVPNGKFQVIEVKPKFKQVLDGYEVVHAIKELIK